MADIFGTSDDEEDVGFPFGLNSDLPVPKGFEDITLPGGDTNSLLGNTDSELFLAGFQPSPNKDSSEAKPSPQVEKPQQNDVVMKTDDNSDKDGNDDNKDTIPSRFMKTLSAGACTKCSAWTQCSACTPCTAWTQCSACTQCTAWTQCSAVYDFICL